MNTNLNRALFFIFFSMLLIFIEFFFPYRNRIELRKKRWPLNFSIALINTLMITLLKSKISFFDFNLMNKFRINNENIFIIVLSLFFLDFCIYLQHRLFHKISFLYQFHKFHHSDRDLDVTSALRFNTVEMLISFFYKLFIVNFFGISIKVFFIFEIVLNAMAMFNHANIYLPEKIEKYLRIFFVTPQMHIIHHSIFKENSNKNFGFNLSMWDYIFNSYQKEFKFNDTIGETND